MSYLHARSRITATMGLVGVRVLTLVSLHGQHGDGMKFEEGSGVLPIGQSSTGALAS